MIAMARKEVRDGEGENEAAKVFELPQARAQHPQLREVSAGLGVGARVVWMDTRGSVAQAREGLVVAGILGGVHPVDVLQAMGVDCGAFDCGPFARDGFSYVVESRGRLYWPPVDALRVLRGGGR